ncbi:unnamed protein product, partial [Musa textilis]
DGAGEQPIEGYGEVVRRHQGIRLHLARRRRGGPLRPPVLHKAEGYRTLAEGEVVEFVVTEGDDGRTKAVDVTGPDGSNVQGGSGGGWNGGYGGGHGGGARSGGYGGGYGFNRSGGGGRVRSGGGFGGGGGGACYNCGEAGHIAKDCYQGGGGGACYNCGQVGHLARDCYQGSGGGGGRLGGGGEGGSLSCYNCGDMGHFARECPGKN